MDVLTDRVQILVLICLLSLIWDQVPMHRHPHLLVIYLGLQVIWQVDQTDLLQVKADLLQVIWQVDQTDLLQVKADLLQVIWQVDQTDLLQATWDQTDLLQVMWQVDQNSDQQPLLLIWDQRQWDPMDLLQAWIWMETECLLHLQVIWVQVNHHQVKVDRIHYLVKVDQLVDRHQVICLQVIQWVNQDQWMADLVLRVICLRQMEWVICILTWMMQEHIKVQKDLLLEILDQCLVICQPICLRHQTIQMTVVR